ncbi:hypothetical protein Back11_57850 [Paenibacillus baekrokdamisoli]|uniref:Uncharacterized protein n=1 Tax=Paenibacillus baekrokdamisoli TaxID=1712516 RepID=A0A3G9IZU4_9BACL|nr:hypothetical protein [Paenibacillus baekrokdamisoli]BBH24440.1 hypothetical protein Back11_57850 [Paenibacillus baekrokdamisoli]
MFIDFLIDGRSLYELVKRHGFIPVLEPEDKNLELRISELTLVRLSPLGGNRYPIFVCAQCGDLDCGYISAIIEESNNMICWRDFKKGEDMKLNHIGPFYFKQRDYNNELNRATPTASRPIAPLL